MEDKPWVDNGNVFYQDNLNISDVGAVEAFQLIKGYYPVATKNE